MVRYKFSVRLDDCELYTCTRKLSSPLDAFYYAKRLQERIRLRLTPNFDNIVIMDAELNIIGKVINADSWIKLKFHLQKKTCK